MKVEYQWSKKRYLEANKANYDFRMKSFKLRVFGYFGIIAILFGVYIFISKGAYTTLIVASILVVYWYIFRWPLSRLLLSLNFRKHFSKDKQITWSIEPESFSITSEDGGGTYNWNSITDISESKAGFLVRQYPVFYWLPKDVFESESDIDWLRNEVVAKKSINKET